MDLLCRNRQTDSAGEEAAVAVLRGRLPVPDAAVRLAGVRLVRTQGDAVSFCYPVETQRRSPLDGQGLADGGTTAAARGGASAGLAISASKSEEPTEIEREEEEDDDEDVDEDDDEDDPAAAANSRALTSSGEM